MALVARRLASIGNKAAFVDLLYDDQTLIASQVSWTNQLTEPVLVAIVAAGGQSLVGRTVQPATVGSLTIPLARQFSVDGASAFSVTLRGA